MKDRTVTLVEGGVGYGHSTFTYLIDNELQRLGITTDRISPLTDGGVKVRIMWHLAKQIYGLAGQNESFRFVYENLRSNNDGASMRDRTVQDLQGHILDNTTVVSDHAYAALPQGFLLQGDVCAGSSYARDPEDHITVFVPVDESRKELISFGHDPLLIEQVGFFVPPELRDTQIKKDRVDRIREGTLHVSYMTSGAHPRHHLALLQKQILPNLKTHLKLSDGRLKLSVYMGTNRSKALDIVTQGIELGIPTTLNNDDTTDGKWGLRVLYSDTVDRAIASSVSLAAESDLVVTMGNERTGFVGEGLPLALLMPIGVNAKHNTRYLIDHKLALPPSQVLHLDTFIEEQLRNTGKDIRQLQRNAARMQIPTNGVENAARVIYQSSQ